MPVDPFGNDSNDYGYDPWLDVVNNAIWAGSDAAKVAASGYPAGSTVTYSPNIQFPGQQPTQAGMPIPGTAPGAMPRQAQQGAGIQLSTTTLIIGGLVLFAFLSGRRGR